MWQKLRNIFRRTQVDEAFFVELEGALLSADVGPALLHEWMAEARKWKTAVDVRRALRDEMLAALNYVGRWTLDVRNGLWDVGRGTWDETTSYILRPTPYVVMVVGVNGVGKTTTIAKLAHQFQQQDLRPLLVAADTFRAAAIDQLEIWAGRLGCPLVAQKPGSDAAAVAYDGVASAIAKGLDVVFVDTAGRLHTSLPLMEELKKVKRVMGKAMPGTPHEIWCVLDATIGQNAISQVKGFHEALSLTGLIVTKMDGTAKAGSLFSICRTFVLPILFVGDGERLTDLCSFRPDNFVDNILGSVNSP